MNAEPAPTTAEHNAGSDERARFRFTLRGLMALFAGVAVGAVEAQLEHACSWKPELKHPRWGDALFACLSAWAAFGLGRQIIDLWRASPKWKSLAPDERWGAKFAIGWRAATILLLFTYHGVRVLLAGKRISLPEESQAFLFEPADALRRAFLCLLLMFALWSAPRLRSAARRRSIAWRGLQSLSLACGAALCLLLWWKLSEMHFLVHVACVGVEAFQPARFAIPNYNIAVHYPAFVQQSLLGVVLAGLSFALSCFLTTSWRHSRGRAFLLLCLGAALAALSWHTARLTIVGVRQVSPWMIEAYEVGPIHRWVTAGLMVCVAAAALAMRQAQTAAIRKHWPLLAWRANVSRYYHEGRSWSAACVLAAGAGIVQEALEMARWNLGNFGTGEFDAILSQPMVAMYAAIGLLAMRATYSQASIEASELTAISLPKFCVAFVTNLVVLGCAIPILAAFSTSLWLTRWYDLPAL